MAYSVSLVLISFQIKAVKIRDLSLGNTEKMLSSPAVAHFWLLSTGHLGVAYNSEMKGHTRFFNWGMLDDTNGLEAKALNQIGMFKDLSAEGIKQYGYFERETQVRNSCRHYLIPCWFSHLNLHQTDRCAYSRYRRLRHFISIPFFTRDDGRLSFLLPFLNILWHLIKLVPRELIHRLILCFSLSLYKVPDTR